VDNVILSNVEVRATRDFFSFEGPFPSYSLSLVSKHATKVAASTSAPLVSEFQFGQQ